MTRDEEVWRWTTATAETAIRDRARGLAGKMVSRAVERGVWAGVLLAAIAGAGCRAPTEVELESRSMALSLSPTMPMALPTPPGAALALQRSVTPPPPLACDQAMVRAAPTDPCGNVSQWTGRILVSTSKAAYCHFSWFGPGSPDFSVLAGADRTVERDCPVVGLSAAAPRLDPPLWRDLADTFRNQLEGLTPRRQSRQAGGGKITVVVVDSAVKTYDSLDDDTFGHGRLVGRTIADLACPQDPFRLDGSADSCALVIMNALAVPRVPDLTIPAGVANPNGGYFGTRGELGDAIASALANWEATHLPGDRLILNLSLGWEAILPPATASVVSNETISMLLERASCQGALSIAAAGNQAGPGSAAGPFLPASWEGRAAPDPSRCQLLWPARPIDPSAASPRPLVYAVAAVDDQDRPLLTTRLGGAPRLVATGIAGVTDDRRGPGHTLILSGSSIAAAVVSGVAAAVWETDGALTGPEVMELIYGTAVALTPGGLNPPTVVCLNPPCERQHRVSLCAALAKVNRLVGAPPPVACPIVAAGAGASPAAVLGQANSTPTACSGCVPSGAPPLEEPWVWPQPSDAACPSCLFLGASCSSYGAGVLGQLDPGFVNSITGAVKRLNLAGAQASVTSVGARIVDDIQPTDFGLGTPLSQATFWLGQNRATSRATISFTIGLSGVPGISTLTTFPQDVPVACP